MSDKAFGDDSPFQDVEVQAKIAYEKIRERLKVKVAEIRKGGAN
jgi:hypothetical protein